MCYHFTPFCKILKEKVKNYLGKMSKEKKVFLNQWQQQEKLFYATQPIALSFILRQNTLLG